VNNYADVFLPLGFNFDSLCVIKMTLDWGGGRKDIKYQLLTHNLQCWISTSITWHWLISFQKH